MKSNVSIIALVTLSLCLSAFGYSVKPNFENLGVKDQIANALNNHFNGEVTQIQAQNVHILNVQKLKQWAKANKSLVKGNKTLNSYLEVILLEKEIDAIQVTNALVTSNNQKTDLIIAKVPEHLQQQLDGTFYIEVFDYESNEGPGGNMMEKCQYNKCYRSSSDEPGTCVSATRFSETCPSSECAVVGAECGTTQGFDLGYIFEVLMP